MEMYIFHFLLFLLTIIVYDKKIICQTNDIVNEYSEEVDKTQIPRDFLKDIEELDLSGYEEDIENIEELSKSDSYSYSTQIYVYIRIDGEYEIYKNRDKLIELGSRYMTVLQAAMLRVQLKRTSIGVFTCFFNKKEMIPDLITFFSIQKEVDFIEADKQVIYPEGRNAPITDREKRLELDEVKLPDDNL